MNWFGIWQAFLENSAWSQHLLVSAPHRLTPILLSKSLGPWTHFCYPKEDVITIYNGRWIQAWPSVIRPKTYGKSRLHYFHMYAPPYPLICIHNKACSWKLFPAVEVYEKFKMLLVQTCVPRDCLKRFNLAVQTVESLENWTMRQPFKVFAT